MGSNLMTAKNSLETRVQRKILLKNVEKFNLVIKYLLEKENELCTKAHNIH